jgi:hypothetical protein
LTPGGSSTVHIYRYNTQNDKKKKKFIEQHKKQYIEQHKKYIEQQKYIEQKKYIEQQQNT